MKRIAITFVTLVAASVATVAAAGDHDTMRDVLAEAPVIVRGVPLDHAFSVDEVLRGEVAGGTITVSLRAGDEPLARGEPMVLLLDDQVDGAYPLHHPAGRYRVDGDDVVRAPDERISLARFRQLAGVVPHVAPVPNSPPLPRAPMTYRSTPPAELPPPADQHSQLPWIAGALVVLVVIVVGIRRAY